MVLNWVIKEDSDGEPSERNRLHVRGASLAECMHGLGRELGSGQKVRAFCTTSLPLEFPF